MLLEKSNKLLDEVKELKTVCEKQMFDSSRILNMDPDDLRLVQSLFSVLDASMEVVFEQSVLLERINEKLDKLLYQNN